MRRLLLSTISLVVLLAACGGTEDPGRSDAGGTRDASTPDAAADPDAGAADSGRPDAGGAFVWPVPTSTIVITPHASWKTTISRDDPFVYADPIDPFAAVRWVKFVVLMRDPRQVYFQDSRAYPFHYEFVTERLDPFLGQSRSEIDRQSLFEQDQELILGAVLFAPREDVLEYGVQLVRHDPYHREMARIVLDLVKQSVESSTAAQSYYFPSYEQTSSAREHQAFFEAAGFPVSSTDRWAEGATCYAPGWALGRIRVIPSGEIDAAYADGRLGPEDILLTDGIPAEVPFVAGILTTVASTPSSHVAILARTLGVPFAFLATEDEQAAARALADREVVLRVEEHYGCEAQVIDAEGQLDETEREELLALDRGAPAVVTPKQRRGAYAVSTEELGPADLATVGGKAAGFGVLRDSIPASAPSPAIALSFDLFDDFLDQRSPGGASLRETIDDKLSLHRYPPDVAQLRADLQQVREWIEAAEFPAPLRTAVISALSPFDASRRIRFRSSANVEDGAELTGAGLYDSVSGCLADETDDDTIGPSRCDASKPGERGVFRAIKKVYASFYNENAVLERLRHGVRETDVAMGLLVHHSHPDEDELANGVATVRLTEHSASIELVTQAGAVSVANPEGGARPEVMRVTMLGGSAYPDLAERSSLVPLGATVLQFPEDYEALARLLELAGRAFQQATAAGPDILLDLEYKKMRPGSLVVKQVRRIPQRDPNAQQDAFLLNQPITRCTFQGEAGDIFANHRTKARWTLSSDTRWLRDLSRTIFAGVTLEYLDLETGAVRTQQGALGGWPEFAHRIEGGATHDGWTIAGSNQRRMELITQVESTVSARQSPIRTLSDLRMSLYTGYQTPVFTIDWMGERTTTEEWSQLGSCPEQNRIDARNLRVERTATAPGGKRIRTSFWWPAPPTGIVAGYTAPLHRWDQTVIEGFTSQPIVLRGYWSQTYRPGHHNFSEELIFEPRLEPGIPAAIVAELEAANIRLFHLDVSSDQGGSISVLGADGSFRRLR